MKSITDAMKCTGCGLCAAICPRNSINMIAASDGFVSPIINQDTCIDCGECLRLCPANSTDNGGQLPIKTYAGHTTCSDIYTLAASGGASTAFAEEIIKRGGCSFGVFDDVGKQPKWICCEHEKDIISYTSGVKYFICPLTISDYRRIASEASKRPVLFVGLPCQVDAVKRYMNRKSGDILYVDLVCQGAPSFKIVELCRTEIEKKQKAKIKTHRFRTKINNHEPYTSKIEFENGSELIISRRDSLFYRAFTTNLFLRESCYRCKYSGSSRISDLTIGDFWGLQSENEHRKFESLILVNTEKGKGFLDSASDFETLERSFEEAAAGNLPLRESVSRPRQRDRSFGVLNKYGIRTALSICDYKGNIKRILYRFCK